MPSATAPAAQLSDVGRLQLELMLHGIRLPEQDGESPQGVDLLLPGDVWVRAAARPNATLALQLTAGGMQLRRVDDLDTPSVPVSVAVAVPALNSFYARTTRRGVPYGAIALIHDRFLVLPSAPHYWIRLTSRLVHSDARGDAALHYTTDDALEVVEAGFREGLMDYLHLETPLTDREDGGIAAVIPTVEAMKGHFDTLISLSAFAPAADSWTDAAYAAGVDAISFGLGCYDADAFDTSASAVLRARGRGRILAALQYAAHLFPSACVCGDLVLGAEPIESARAGIDALGAMGVLPGLLRPVPSLGGPGRPVAMEMAAELWQHAIHVIQHRPGKAAWVRHFHIAAHALDGALLPLRRERRFGVSLSKLRRALRVQKVSESYDSSGL